MKVPIFTAGRAGDTHPFVGIGRVLANRGHEVVVFGNEVFSKSIRGPGLGFVQTGDAALYERAISNPDLWDSRKGFEAATRPFVGLLREWVPLIESHLGQRPFS